MTPSPKTPDPAAGERRAHPGRVRVLALSLVLLVLAAACGTGRELLTEEGLDQVAVRNGVPPSAAELPFRLTPEMRAWLDEKVPRRQTFEQRLHDLLAALLYPQGLDMRYDPGFTGTAAEVFEQQRANCLGFTNLFVAMARELGVPVYFLAVDEVEGYDRDEDLVVVSRHITAGYGPPHDLKVLEFTLGPELSYHSVRRVDDLTAVALYYSNRGAEMLRAAQGEGATRMLRVATALDPELPIAWLNLGVALRRTGDLEGAERSYRRALDLEPRSTSVHRNLVSLLRQRGEEVEAERMLARIEELGSRNPYNYLALGDEALARGDAESARRHYRKALRLDREDAEPYAALGQWALSQGDREEARRWLEKAAEIDTRHPRVRRLALRLGVGGAVSASRDGRQGAPGGPDAD